MAPPLTERLKQEGLGLCRGIKWMTGFECESVEIRRDAMANKHLSHLVRLWEHLMKLMRLIDLHQGLVIGGEQVQQPIHNNIKFFVHLPDIGCALPFTNTRHCLLTRLCLDGLKLRLQPSMSP